MNQRRVIIDGGTGQQLAVVENCFSSSNQQQHQLVVVAGFTDNHAFFTAVHSDWGPCFKQEGRCVQLKSYYDETIETRECSETCDSGNVESLYSLTLLTYSLIPCDSINIILHNFSHRSLPTSIELTLSQKVHEKNSNNSKIIHKTKYANFNKTTE